MKIGIDCGSKFLKIALFEEDLSRFKGIYLEHHGLPQKTLNSAMQIDLSEAVLTGSHAGLLESAVNGHRRVQEVTALIDACRYFGLPYRNVVHVGAGSIGLIGRDEKGGFASFKENNLCAAGTGSFIDEQMHRLGLSYGEIAELPVDPGPPVIATRCAVFAKSDITHRQQEGHGPSALWSGLCRGVVSTMVQSVFRGDLPEDDVLFCGGIFLNPAVRYWTSWLVPGARYHDHGHMLAAAGAALLSESSTPSYSFSREGCAGDDNGAKGIRLKLRRSIMPDFSCRKSYESGGCEVRIHADLHPGVSALLGIDIGSTSTKLVLVEGQSSGALVDIYTRTGGNPLEATARLFRELMKVPGAEAIEISACGTTGSGRKLVGAVIGADAIVNEITAHFKGALFFDSSIETIFEIGGQDSKYIRGRDGVVGECNMNFVCAAGTGSFIEEQANRLGFDVREIGPKIAGILSPHASDRCTVFMEQDINRLLRESRPREEVLAAVVLSIAKNYLNRVVGPRPVTGEKIFFQGATARNVALVAAFESLLEKEIVVSPFCHVMGAYGAALAAGKSGRRSAFRGLGVLENPVDLSYERCNDCSNACTITVASFSNGERVSWGHLCGREEGAGRARGGRSHFPGASIGGAQNGDTVGRGVVGIPLALSMHNYLPLWKTFLERLGFSVKVSSLPSDLCRERAVRLAKTDFCFPVKAALAHTEALSVDSNVDILFYPSIISEKKQRNGMPRVFCPYVISFPSISKSLEMGRTVLSPVVDFRDERSVTVKELCRVFAPYGIGRREIDRAFRAGEEALQEQRRALFERGLEALASARRRSKKTVVFIGRPYNLYDTVLNLNLPERFRHYGVDIIPCEMLIDPEEQSEVHYMYWNYGELILHAAEKVRNMDGVYPVYLTNFSCGPDSFILGRFESIMEGKPYLIIELDEHGSETGYITRIEAFLDIILEEGREEPERYAPPAKAFARQWRGKDRKLWIPPMHEVAARLFAAGFRAWGFDAEALPGEDLSACVEGKRGIRGGECLPAAATIGAFIKKMRDTGADPSRQALFMPTAEGPCRFGQYAVLHRAILDREGFRGAAIFSPSSVNSYMGMPNSLRLYLWDVLLASDMIMKALCRVRPYEATPGTADRLLEEELCALERGIENRVNMVDAASNTVRSLFGLPRAEGKRPLVGIVGEIYVRCNPFCNNGLIRVIEGAGGEAWLAPVSEWVLYTSWFEDYYTGLVTKNPLKKIAVGVKSGFMFRRERLFEEALAPYLSDRFEHHVSRVLREGGRYLPVRFEGEAILTLGRSALFFEDGASMVVNCAPFGCMPGNITASLFSDIQSRYNRPVLTLFYDGESDVNRAVEVYLGNMRKEENLTAVPARV